MSMESAAWSTLYRTISAQQERRPFSRVTIRRIAAFARPQRVALGCFILLSVVGAFLAVATPLLAGQVIDAITTRAAPGVVVRLALLIAGIAVVEAGGGGPVTNPRSAARRSQTPRPPSSAASPCGR